eukprot:evm.model.scf_1181.1 EVM.evm.TU.scf_1181.1   scf_1181:17945-25715(-)
MAPCLDTRSMADMTSLQTSRFDALHYSPDPITTSLLKLHSEESTAHATEMFCAILKYMAIGVEHLPGDQQVEILEGLLHEGLTSTELRDELYMQLIRQTRRNPTVEGRRRVWELFSIVASTMPPSKEFVGLVSEHVHVHSTQRHEDAAVSELMFRTLNALKRTTKTGARTKRPSSEEIEAHLAGQTLSCVVFLLDDTFEELEFTMNTTVQEALDQLSASLKLPATADFSLFECRRLPKGQHRQPDVQHRLLDSDWYVADVLHSFGEAKSREGAHSKLLMKKRIFRKADEGIMEPRFVHLMYIQMQYEYLLGNYPVAVEDAAQLCALQIQAEGDTRAQKETDIAQAIDLYIPKQVFSKCSKQYWYREVRQRHEALSQFSKDDARLQFHRSLGQLTYGNSAFFPVLRLEDPMGTLPLKLVISVNKHGIHFFRRSPRDHLHSAELSEIVEFGASSQAVFFKVKLAGMLCLFHFETAQGEDICCALQTHINDRMLAIYAKAARAAETQKAQEGHAQLKQQIAQLKKELDERNEQIEHLQRHEKELLEVIRTLKAENAGECKATPDQLKAAVPPLTMLAVSNTSQDSAINAVAKDSVMIGAETPRNQMIKSDRSNRAAKNSASGRKSTGRRRQQALEEDAKENTP